MTAITLPKIGLMLASPPKGEVLSTLVGTHLFDIKIDGVRVLLYWDGAACRLVNRSGVDVTAQYPEVCESACSCFEPGIPLILDGEVVAKSGSFQDTAKRSKQNKPADIQRTMAAIPVVFVTFDLLWLSDRDLRSHTYEVRRHNLEVVVGKLPICAIQLSVVSPNPAFFEQVKALGMEGIIAKRKDSTYRAGRFSDWIKWKAVQSITCIGIGYEAGQGARAHFGAMFLALIDTQAGTTLEVGRVGTGFKAADIAELKGELDAGRLVVVEIECLNKSRDNKLRFPSFKGIRTDLSVSDATVAQLATLPTM